SAGERSDPSQVHSRGILPPSENPGLRNAIVSRLGSSAGGGLSQTQPGPIRRIQHATVPAAATQRATASSGSAWAAICLPLEAIGIRDSNHELSRSFTPV